MDSQPIVSGIPYPHTTECLLKNILFISVWHVDDVPVVIASLVIYSVAGGDFVHKANKKMKIWLIGITKGMYLLEQTNFNHCKNGMKTSTGSHDRSNFNTISLLAANRL